MFYQLTILRSVSYQKNNKQIGQYLSTFCKSYKSNLHISNKRCLPKINIFNTYFPVLQNQRFKSIKDKYNFFIDIVEDTSPALVKISRIANVPFFSVPIGNGSGFIVDSSGLIVTNAHVVGKSRVSGVRLFNGKKYEGQVLGLDLVRDIAVLKIEAENLPTIKMAEEDPKVGEWVLAMGSPLSLKNTVTAGIVSNINRAGYELGLDCEKSDLGYIQTDATINVGNSGGPLLNLDGNCVGMNTMMASIGIAFALPTVHLLDFLQQVKDHGNQSNESMKRYLGVRMWTLTNDFIQNNRSQLPNFPKNVTKGVYILYVEPESPADKAGLRVHDIIIAIDGVEIESASEVAKVVKSKDSFDVIVMADGEEFELNVEIVENNFM